MSFKIRKNGKYSVTDLTFKLVPFTMHTPVMLLHITLTIKPFFTQITAKWTDCTVYANVFLQTTLVSVGLITHTASERTLSSMQALMFLHITLITHIT